jgi:hypothetical protein
MFGGRRCGSATVVQLQPFLFMEQETFSSLVYRYLLENHPLFLENIKYHPDQTFDCSLTSPTGKFAVWIATYNMEITIGMDDPDQTSGTHTHMSFYGNEVDEQTRALTEYLHDIFTNKLVFIHSSLSGYSWSKDIVSTLLEKESNEAIEYFTWTDDV